MHRVLACTTLDALAHKARKLLSEVGYLVHCEEMVNRLKKSGLKELPNGRLAFDEALIDEFVAVQEDRRKLHEAGKAPIAEPPGRFALSFGNMPSKYYDHPSRCAQTARMDHLVKLVKFAHQEERINGISMPVSVTDIPLLTAPIEAFLTMVRLTDKYHAALDPMSSDLVKYVVELSDIFLGCGRQNEFFDHCNCINPIMRLEERTASMMLERAKYSIDTLMTSMPATGGNSPVTLDGTIILGTAEIVGGLIVSYLINPDVNHVGYISSGSMDFKTATTTQSSPETVLIDCGVWQLKEHAFGGNTGIGGRTYVSANRPGMQAVFEKMMKTVAYQQYTGGLWYGGGGILDNGSTISPEQLLVDIDIAESFHKLQAVEDSDDDIEALIAEIAASGTGDFLSTEHTLKNFRGAFWEPQLFTRGDTNGERDILDKAHQYYADRVGSYSGHDFDTDKVSAGEKILARAKQELLG